MGEDWRELQIEVEMEIGWDIVVEGEDHILGRRGGFDRWWTG